jgi:hypothetical protein
MTKSRAIKSDKKAQDIPQAPRNKKDDQKKKPKSQKDKTG